MLYLLLSANDAISCTSLYLGFNALLKDTEASWQEFIEILPSLHESSGLFSGFQDEAVICFLLSPWPHQQPVISKGESQRIASGRKVAGVGKMQETCQFCGVFVGGQQSAGTGERLHADSISFQWHMELMQSRTMKPHLIGKLSVIMSGQAGFCALAVLMCLVSVTDGWTEAEQRTASEPLAWMDLPSACKAAKARRSGAEILPGQRRSLRMLRTSLPAVLT